MTTSTAVASHQALVMVLVTDQIMCERLITSGKRLADKRNASLMVINIGRPSTAYNPDAIEHLFRVSREHGAAMSIYYSEDPEKQLISIIRDEAPEAVVTGMPQRKDSLLHKLWMLFEPIDFYTVDLEENLKIVTIQDKVAE